MPVYVVAPNRTLTEIALLRPRCPEDLAMVHGMGPARIAAYGEGILSVVRRHPLSVAGEPRYEAGDGRGAVRSPTRGPASG